MKLRGMTSREGMRGMGLSLDTIWDTGTQVVTSPSFWGAITGQSAAQAPAPTTIIYQTPPAAGAPAPKNYTPWILGGVGVLALGGFAVWMSKRSKR